MRLAIGTAQFGAPYGIANKNGRVDAREVGKILESAYSYGIDTLDTAVLYGESERVLGDAGVHGFKVVSKLPEVPEGCAEISTWINREVINSLERLKISQLYALLLHVPSQLKTFVRDSLILGLDRCQSEGLIHKIGISVYEPEDLDIYLNLMNVEIVQIPLNLLDQRFISSGSLNKLQLSNIEVHARSAFLQGLLLMNLEDQIKLFPFWEKTWVYWHQWLQQEGISALQACLLFASSIQGVTRTVVGVDSHQQLREILAFENQILRSVPNWPQTISKNLINPSLWTALQ